MRRKLDKSAHSVYSLHYHLVIVVKYRRKALYDDVIRERLKQIIWSLTDDLGIEILARNLLKITFMYCPSPPLKPIWSTL